MTPSPSGSGLGMKTSNSMFSRFLPLYLFLVIALSGIALGYGFTHGEVTEREASYLLAGMAENSSHAKSLVAERSTSLAIAIGFVALLAVAMKRSAGWWGVGAMLVGLATSPVMMQIASTATPDICLVALLSVPVIQIIRQPSVFGAIVAGTFLLLVGLVIHADLVLFGGRLSASLQGAGLQLLSMSTVVVGFGLVTVYSSWLIGITAEAWANGKFDHAESERLRKAAATAVILVPLACIVIGSIRLMGVFQYLERVDITLAAAWIVLALAIGQIRLRMPEAHFFPILVVVIAAKITWVHALQRERDLHQSSAVVARAVAHAVTDHESVMIDTPVDPVFRFTLLSACGNNKPQANASHWMIVSGDENLSPALAANVVRRFVFPDGRTLKVLKSNGPKSAISSEEPALAR